MGSPLPDLTRDEFRHRLLHSVEIRFAETPLTDEQIHLLWIHYQELRLWNPRLSLVGPGTADEVVERHYGESLAALPLLDPFPNGADDDGGTKIRSLVDVGTGGGFPGLVLAVARPDLRVTLIEPRQRKVAFLRSALRKIRQRGIAQGKIEKHSRDDAGSLSCRVLDARVQGSLPAGIDPIVDVVTSRALAWSHEIRDPFLERFPELRLLLWTGAETPRLDTEVPGRSLRHGREIPLAGRRRIVEVVSTRSRSSRQDR